MLVLPFHIYNPPWPIRVHRESLKMPVCWSEKIFLVFRINDIDSIWGIFLKHFHL